MTEAPAREAMEYDVVIVGAGPAGLAAAIRLKQLDENRSVVVVEKGSTIGAHILSGVVIDPVGLDRLLPEWREDPDRPLTQEVTDDRFYVLGSSGHVKVPNFLMPPLMTNHGNFIGSLGALTRWMGAKAEALAVEIYPGFAATELLYGDKGEVVGVATGDMGIGKDGEREVGFHAGHRAARQVHADRRGRPWLASQAASAKIQPRSGLRTAEVRHRPQGDLAGRPGEIRRRTRAAFVRLAAHRNGRDRRRVPLPL